MASLPANFDVPNMWHTRLSYGLVSASIHRSHCAKKGARLQSGSDMCVVRVPLKLPKQERYQLQQKDDLTTHICSRSPGSALLPFFAGGFPY